MNKKPLDNLNTSVNNFSRTQTIIVCALGLFFGLIFFVFKVIGWDFAYYPGDLGDGRFNMYILEHAYKFLIGNENSLWNAPFMFPEKNIITYSDNLIGSAPLYSIFRILGADRELSFQCWFVLVCSLNYLCGFTFLNSVLKNPFSASLGAFVFAFSMALQSQISHAQTFPRFAIPIAFLMIYNFFKELKPIYFGLAILALVYQFYCAIYLGFLLVFPLVISIVFVFVFRWQEIKKLIKETSWKLKIAFLVFCNLLLLIPLMMPYYERSKSFGLNSYENIYKSIPTFGSYLFSQKGSLLWDFMSKYLIDSLQSFWEHQIFSGAIATLCFVFFLFLVLKMFYKLNDDDSKFVKVILFTSLITFLFFVRIDNFSLYAILFKVPGFASLRSLTRIINIQLLFFSFSVAYIFNVIWKQKIKFKLILFILSFAMLILDNYFFSNKIYRKEKSIVQKREFELINKLSNVPKTSVISYEPKKIENSIIDYQIDAMFATQTLNLFCLNGYTSTSPPNYGNYWEKPDSVSRIGWLENKDLGKLKIVIVH